MPEQSASRKQFLMVDDDPAFLATVAALLNEMSQGRWVIRTATNHSQAFELLNEVAEVSVFHGSWLLETCFIFLTGYEGIPRIRPDPNLKG